MGEGGDGRGVGGVAYRANMVRCRTTQNTVRGHDAFLECGWHGKVCHTPDRKQLWQNVVAHRARRAATFGNVGLSKLQQQGVSESRNE